MIIERHDFKIPIHTERDLADFIQLAFGIQIPSTKVCANHVAPWDAFKSAYFAESPVAVWKASRGLGGKSFLLALLGLTEALTLKADVNILGGSGKQSQNVKEHIATFWQHPNSPRQLLRSDVLHETRLAWGNSIEALMASQTSVRGPHPQRLRLDEVDEMDLAILDAALGQPMSKNGIASQVVASSTHQYTDGTMTECIRRCADMPGWKYFEWCYKENLEPNGWLLKSEVERKRLQMSQIAWATEVEGQEPNPASRAIHPDAVAKMFKRELGEFDGAVREYIEIESPQEFAEYATGADWARKQDWTIITTLKTDCRPMRLVAWERLGRESWDAMISRFDDRVKRFGGSAYHDGTGLGDVVADQIKVGAESFMMIGRERANLLSEYIAAIERGEIISPYIRYLETEHRLASVDDVYGAGHLPDTISSGALAYRAASQVLTGSLVI